MPATSCKGEWENTEFVHLTTIMTRTPAARARDTIIFQPSL